jgi:hypothetical protein
VRVGLDGRPSKILSLPIEQPMGSDYPFDDTPGVHLRTFENRVAIGARVKDADGGAKLRIITLQTTTP